MRKATNRLPGGAVAALVAPAAVFLAAFYVWPVLSLATTALSAGAISDAWNDAALREIVWFTTWQAALSTTLTVGIGLVPTWLLARHDFLGRRAILALVTIPFFLPTVVVGAAFLALLPASLDNSIAAIVMAHVFLNIAVVVRVVAGVWEQLPQDLVAAARTLGASPWRVMREVTIPLLAPAIAAAASIVFLFTFTSFGVVRLVGGPANATLEVEIWQRATRLGDAGVAAVVSIAQLIALGLGAWWFSRFQHRRRLSFGLRPVGPRRRLRTAREQALVIVTAVGVVAVVAVPLIALVERSLRTGTGGGHSFAAWRAVFSGEQPGGRTVRGSVDALGSLTTSLRFALIAMLISTVVGATASFAITALGRAGRLLDAGVMLPLGTSAVTIGFGLILAFDTPPLDWRAAPLLIPLGQSLVAIPFVVRAMLPVISAIDPRLRQAAATLGASPLRAWREVDLRFAARPIAVGAGFAMAISLGEFGATTLLTRRGRATLPIAIEQLLNRPGAALHAQGYVLATVLAVLTFAVIGLVELRRGPGGDRA